jgi:hypothetical protein
MRWLLKNEFKYSQNNLPKKQYSSAEGLKAEGLGKYKIISLYEPA